MNYEPVNLRPKNSDPDSSFQGAIDHAKHSGLDLLRLFVACHSCGKANNNKHGERDPRADLSFGRANHDMSAYPRT